MKSRRILATTVVAAAAATLVAAPAMAYDRDAYSHAAGAMIERSDVPKVLGDFKKNLGFSAFASSDKIYVCDVPQADPNAPDVVVYMPGSKYTFNGSYQAKGKNDPATIAVAVNQYASASDAIDAFDALKRNIKKCTGTGSNTWTDEDGKSTTYSTELTHGVVPAVTTTGVESLFISNNSLSATTPGDSRFVNDDYSVYSLVDDVIIVTEYSANTNDNLTTKQRKAVNQVAFNAESRWLD